jgi:hypothetical protein
MFNLILRLRARPLAYRRKVAFWSAVGITALITLIWIISLSIRFDGINETSEPQPPGPLETFLDQVRNGASSIKDAF